MKPTAFPRELIRCWEERTIDKRGKEKVKKKSLMRPCDIPQYRTRFFQRCMELYNTWRTFKQTPPMGQGWGNERSVTCRILRILFSEDNLYDQWKRDKEEDRRRK